MKVQATVVRDDFEMYGPGDGGVAVVVDLGRIDHELLPTFLLRLRRVARGDGGVRGDAHYYIAYTFDEPFQLEGFINTCEGQSFMLRVRGTFDLHPEYHLDRKFVEPLRQDQNFLVKWGRNLQRLGRTEAEIAEEQNKFLDGYRIEDLKKSLEVWGRTFNADGDGGEGGVNGYHAGLVHYFEYRAKADKFGRFRGQPCTWGGFMALTWKLSEYMKNEVNPDVAKRVLFQDEEGHRQGYVLTKDGDLVIAFGYPGQSLKVVSHLVGQSIEKFEKMIAREMDPLKRPTEGRYNQTVGELTEIPWKREAK